MLTQQVEEKIAIEKIELNYFGNEKKVGVCEDFVKVERARDKRMINGFEFLLDFLDHVQVI